MAQRSDLYPMMQEVARLMAEARGRGDEATYRTLQVRMLDLVKLNEAWRKAEQTGAPVAPFIRDMQVQSRQVSMARLAEDRKREAEAKARLEVTQTQARAYAEQKRQEDLRPGIFDKLLSTLQQGGMVVTLGALVALALLLRGGGRREW